MCLADSTGNSLQISTVKSKLSYFAIKKLSPSLSLDHEGGTRSLGFEALRASGLNEEP